MAPVREIGSTERTAKEVVANKGEGALRLYQLDVTRGVPWALLDIELYFSQFDLVPFVQIAVGSDVHSAADAIIEATRFDFIE